MFYKYRGISNFRFFTDIILKKRLYAAPYFDLNDPMEGRYIYSGSIGQKDEKIIRLIKGEKENLKICSLSRNPNIELMWSHYSDGHRGVVIGVEVDETRYTMRDIEYDGLYNFNSHSSRETAIDILSHKNEVWDYEEEVRVFIHRKKYIAVKVREVICGSRMSPQDYGFIRDLVEKIDPRIEIKKQEISSEFYFKK